jgi:hypothetical protein
LAVELLRRKRAPGTLEGVEHGWRLLCGCALLGACVFELPEIVSTSASGAGGQGGAGLGGGGAASTPTHEVLIGLVDAPNQPLSDFPLLVRLDATRIDYPLTHEGGRDLRFYALDGTTRLPHEIEHWAPGGDSFVWLKLPSYDFASGGVLMRFGDAGAVDDQAPEDVWTSYLAVYHFAEDPAAGMVHDSTAEPRDGTPLDVAALATGAVGASATLNGSTSRIDFGPIPDFDVPPGEQRSFSLMFQRTAVTSFGTIGRTMNDLCIGWELAILGDEYANVRLEAAVGSDCGMRESFVTNPTALPAQDDDVEWHHMIAVVDRVNEVLAVYLDGEPFASVSGFTSEETMDGGDVVMGVDPFEMDEFLAAHIDEVRFSSRAESAEWARFTYLTLTDALLEFGPVTEIEP